ncbi:BTA121 domain-containing protein surface lipoprotein [Borrelia turicatae]|uniref:BTA121 domain-containing protein surface lipoprotein n=1 Tax=Borrelia turicatae TaxID=142 RepID=UPI002ED06A82
MVKIKCFSVLLVLILLLLLVISCDSGSKAGSVTNTRALVKPVALTGTGSVTNTETEEEIEEVVGDEEALAYLEDKVTYPKLKELLNKFGVSGAGRKAIGYIQEILSVSSSDGFDDKFYNYLNKLGADVVIEKIIKPTVSLLRARGKALRVIQGITDEGVKTRLQDMLSSCDYVVSFTWYLHANHLVFHEGGFADAFTYYVPKFRKFKEMVKNPRVIDVYAWLDADEQATIDEIGNIVISATYDKDKFNNVLNSVSDCHVVKIISFCRLVKKMQEGALKAIEGVSDDAEKQNLKTRFNTLKGEYYSHIRDAFNKSEDDLYSQITNNSGKYHDNFIGLRNDAKAAAAAAKAEESTEAGEPREGSGTDKKNGTTGSGVNP